MRGNTVDSRLELPATAADRRGKQCLTPRTSPRSSSPTYRRTADGQPFRAVCVIQCAQNLQHEPRGHARRREKPWTRSSGRPLVLLPIIGEPSGRDRRAGEASTLLSSDASPLLVDKRCASTFRRVCCRFARQRFTSASSSAQSSVRLRCVCSFNLRPLRCFLQVKLLLMSCVLTRHSRFDRMPSADADRRPA